MGYEELSMQEIAERLGCSKLTVRRTIQKLNLRPVSYVQTGGPRRPLYEFSESKWKALQDQYASVKQAYKMPSLGKEAFTIGYLDKFGTPEQQTILKARDKGVEAVIEALEDLEVDNIVQAELKEQEMRKRGAFELAGKNDFRELADAYLVSLGAIWDLLEYLVEEDILAGYELDRAFKQLKKGNQTGINLDRPAVEDVDEARQRIADAQRRGVFASDQGHKDEAYDEFEAHDLPTEKELRAALHAEFKELAAPLLLALSSGGIQEVIGHD
jgi:DNA-binding Lrp family transcriptional regulator